MDYQEVVAKLRSTKSRSKRELLDTAANFIEGLAEESFRLYQAERERSKGCLYCDGTEEDLYFHEGACSQMNDVVYISGNQINCDFGCKAWGSFEIKFCPMCGRKLEVEKN